MSYPKGERGAFRSSSVTALYPKCRFSRYISTLIASGHSETDYVIFTSLIVEIKGGKFSSH